MGDFNVVDSDYPHPFHEVTLNRNADIRLYDVQESFWKSWDIPSAQK